MRSIAFLVNRRKGVEGVEQRPICRAIGGRSFLTHTHASRADGLARSLSSSRQPSTTTVPSERGPIGPDLDII